MCDRLHFWVKSNQTQFFIFFAIKVENVYPVSTLLEPLVKFLSNERVRIETLALQGEFQEVANSIKVYLRHVRYQLGLNLTYWQSNFTKR